MGVSVTFTGATKIAAAAYRNVFAINTAGDSWNGVGQNPGTNSISYLGMSSATHAAPSWYGALAIHKSATNVSTAPAAMTNIDSGISSHAAAHDTNGNKATTWGTTNVTVNASDVWASYTYQLASSGGTVTRVGTAYASSATVALPDTVAVGDLLLVLAVADNAGSGTTPAIPAAWTGTTSSSIGLGVLWAWKVATSDDVASTFVPVISVY